MGTIMTDLTLKQHTILSKLGKSKLEYDSEYNKIKKSLSMFMKAEIKLGSAKEDFSVYEKAVKDKSWIAQVLYVSV